MIETVAADQWLHATLTGDATLTGVVAGRVYADLAPPDSELPAVVFSEQAPTDSIGVDGARILVQALWLVRVIADTTSWHGTLKTAADRIDTVLHNTSGAAAGGVTVGKCVRESSYRLVDTAHGKQYRHLGGIYRLILHTP